MMITSDNIDLLASALALAQGELEPAVKDAKNLHLKNRYASLASLWTQVRQVLPPNGLALLQGFSVNGSNGDYLTLHTRLTHISGQWIESVLEMRPMDIKPQSVGSAITYMRRYGMSALLGLVADEDDDGHAASTGGAKADGHAASTGGAKAVSPQPPKETLHLSERMRSCLEVFAQHNLSQVDLERVIGSPLTKWTDPEFDRARKWLEEIDRARKRLAEIAAP